MLFRHEAVAPTKSGKPAIVPGNADASEMIRRLTLEDHKERMPLIEDNINYHQRKQEYISPLNGPRVLKSGNMKTGNNSQP